MLQRLKAIISSYPEILFLHGKLPGLVLCAVLLLNPSAVLTGMIAVVAALSFSYLVHMEDEFAASGAHTYNPLLVGLSVGYMYQITWVTVGLAIVAGLLTFLATAMLIHLFQLYLKLPVLSVPFCVVSAILGLAVFHYHDSLHPALPATTLTRFDPELPLWAAGYFKSFSAILFSPSVLVGIVFSLMVLYCSRILFLLSILGYAVGTFFRAQLLGSSSLALQDLTGFNFILIAMALGGVFLVPSLRSYLLAVIAVALSAVVLDSAHVFTDSTGVRTAILPFNVITLAVIYVLGVARSPFLAWSPGRTPEETLENVLADRLRYRGQQQTLFLPFSGKWKVWQSFDGKWTHKGSSRYACDFVVVDDAGRTCSAGGSRLDDFFAFRKPVLSPVRGWVIKVLDTLPDNAPARVAASDQSGNFVLLKDVRGFYVKLCHFAEKSIRAAEGQWVERGQILGLCGNSGYSPQPHIHVQVQAGESNSAATIPFSFVNYIDGDEYHANDVPALDHEIEPLYPDKRLDALVNFVLDETQNFTVHRGEREIGRLAMKVCMALDGSFHFASDRGKLHFGRHEGTFYFYRADGDDPWLQLLLLALPRLPLAYREGMAWNDYVPVGLATHGIKRALVRFLSSFYPDLAKIRVVQTFTARNRIETRIESQLLGVRQTATIELDDRKGFASIKCGDVELRRLKEEPVTAEHESPLAPIAEIAAAPTRSPNEVSERSAAL
ncbi:MAG TPA: urea transporter [Planctomycetota bacterium]|jgi:urea transporter